MQNISKSEEYEIIQSALRLTRIIGEATEDIRRDIARMRVEKAGLNPDSGQESHITTHYIWHMQHDDKVRSSHAANDGKIFAWNDAPPTGHPREDHGCRCWAEPLPERLEEKKAQIVTFAEPDVTPAWGNEELAAYYKFGDGEDLTLHDIGLLQRVIEHARTHDQTEAGGGTLFERVENQIFKKAREKGPGNFKDGFERGRYDFGGVLWTLGHVPVHGDIDIHVTEKEEYLIITAEVVYRFIDYFRIEALNDEPEGEGTRIPGDRKPSTIGTRAFYIRDEWKTRLEAIIRKNSSEGQFRTP